ncbi:MAG: peptide MFS transporter [Chitinophagaceae bacterium]
MSEQATKGHPKGLYVLFVTEMWERFSYYGMRALFVLFMTKALLFDKAFGSQVYGSYTGLVYLTPLIGGYMADRYWGNRKSIIVGGVLMAAGQFFMFLAGTFFQQIDFASMMMYIGLTFLILGNGFFKPNISTMVGQLYPQGDKRVDSAFTIFYMGINLGAFIAPLLCGYLGDTGNPADFRWGFLAACVGMILSLVLFIFLKNKYIVTPEGEQIGMAPNKARMETVEVDTAGEVKKTFPITTIIIWGAICVALFAFFKLYMEMDIIGCFIFSLTISAPGLIISDPSLTKVEKQRIWVIYIVAFFVIFFWSAFEQAGASLTYFAEEQTNRTLFGKTIPTSYFQSINAVAIVIFAPLFVWLWGGLGKRNMEPASPFKQSIGLFLLALGYLVIAMGVQGINPSTKLSMIWLVSLYTIHTFGELCLSPIGLSMVNKLAPVKLASLLMGVWFLSTAAANKFAGTLSELYPEEVKMEKSINSHASPEIMAMLNAQVIDTNTWKLDPAGKTQIAYASVSLDKTNKDSKTADSITNVSVDSVKKDISVYALKVIKSNNRNFNRVIMTDIKDGDNSYPAIITHDSVEVVVNRVSTKKEVVQVWNLKPKKPSFLGMQISTLYDFFMLFVYMAGIASIILFFLSKKLLNMMGGVR